MTAVAIAAGILLGLLLRNSYRVMLRRDWSSSA